jgi:hypothetical protein
MSSRANSHLLLVGSLPAKSTDEALRNAGECFGDLVFALPDGDIGPRATWVGYDTYNLIQPHRDVEVTTLAKDFPRHSYEMPILAVKS